MVGEGVVKSLARPNGNTTGISILATELDGKRQDLLIEAVPGIRRMAALADSSTLTEAKARALQEAARAHNVELSIYRITRGEEIAAAIDKAQASGATALNVFASPMLDGNGQLIMERVAALRLPAMYQWPEMGRGRWLCRLRPTPRSVGRPYCPICGEPFARHEACRSADRAADQVRAGDQPQDR